MRAGLLAKLRDPNLVRVLAVRGTEDGAPYMALEHLDGPSLEVQLRVGPLPGREMVDLTDHVRSHPPRCEGFGHHPTRRSDGGPVAKLIALRIAKVPD
jgi:hypothetical protein